MQAYEVISKIEQHYSTKSGMMCCSWRIDYILFLFKRWEWKSPMMKERIKVLVEEHIPRIKNAINMNRSFLPMYKLQMEEMMVGAGLKCIQKNKKFEVDSTEIKIPTGDRNVVLP